MKKVAAVIILFSMTSQVFSSTIDARWQELSNKYRTEILRGIDEKEMLMTQRQKHMAQALVQGLPQCALMASHTKKWEGDRASRIIFEEEIKRCVIQQFSKQLDREDWRMAEEINTVVKKIAPKFAMPGVDDRE